MGSRGGEQDAARAAELVQKGCDMGSAQACRAMALMLSDRGNQKPDPDRAKALFERACGLGDATSCERLRGGG